MISRFVDKLSAWCDIDRF